MQDNTNITLTNTFNEDPPDICGNCSRETRNEIRTHIEGEDIRVCNRCNSRHFRNCDYCEDRHRQTDLVYTYDSQLYCCEYCRDDYDIRYDEHTNRWYSEGLPNPIRSYDYKPDTVFHSINSEGRRKHSYDDVSKRLYAGVEIEVENEGCESTRETAYRLLKMNDELGRDSTIYLKYDGSIESGFEVVSQPRTWESWKRAFDEEFEPVFNLTEDGFRSHNTETCGLHISLSRSAFSELHLFRFQRFIYFNPDFIAVLSRRTLDNLIEWGNPYAVDATRISRSSLELRMERETENDYCGEDRRYELHEENDSTPFYRHRLLNAFVNHQGAPIYTSKALMDNAKNKRGTALNLPSGENRVELRFFRGTLKQETFEMNLEFAFCAYHFTSQTLENALTVQNLRRFAKKQGFKRVFNYLDALPWGVREKWSQDYIKTHDAELVAINGGNPTEGSV
jgi:hypothetical protein